MINKTFGAPFGGTIRGSQHGFDSRESRLMTPPNGLGSGGSCFSELRDAVPAAEHGSEAGCWARAPLAANVATEIPANANLRIRAVNRLPMTPLLLNDS